MLLAKERKGREKWRGGGIMKLTVRREVETHNFPTYGTKSNNLIECRKSKKNDYSLELSKTVEFKMYKRNWNGKL